MSLLIESTKGIRLGVFHFPKTGGTWLREVVSRCEPLTWHNSPCKPTHSRHYGMYSWEGSKPDVALTLVREPKAWIESWWRYTTPDFPVFQGGMAHPCRWADRLVERIGKDAGSFENYLAAYLEHYRGEIDNMYLHLTNRIDFCFQMENAVSLIGEILDLCEVDADPQALADSVPPQNVSPKIETPWSDEALHDFTQATNLAQEIYQNSK